VSLFGVGATALNHYLKPDIAAKVQPLIAARLREKTKKYGLSLGDRACLSLAKLKSFPVLTADKIWAKLSVGVEIKIIR
jgi:PIN domain nuclease of toxin-antitoxin system